ncbi:hypothetical protein [Cytobacillus purgationiresistens]|uniref:hypothetical protein n=1 Tax=Cytobacillus purgationiresistens TaxID=863449 RepID=UPI0027D8AAA0|nr:hypothetical protein [Cytobacillus purgationiresistens]
MGNINWLGLCAGDPLYLFPGHAIIFLVVKGGIILTIDNLLSGVMPLEEINEGFDQLATGEVNRMMVIP